MAYLYFLIVCLLSGSNFYLMKLATAYYGPVTIGAGRVLGGAAALVVLWRFTARSERIPRSLLPAGVAIGVVSSGYPFAVQPWILGQGVEHSFLAMMVAFTPISIMLMSIPVLGVWPSNRQVFGVAAGMGCLTLLLSDGYQRGVSLGILMLMISVPLSYGMANAFLKRKLSRVGALPTSTTMLLSAGVLLTPLAIVSPSVGLPGPETPHNWLTATCALGVLGCMGTGVNTWLWVRMVREQGPLFAGMVTYVVPVVAIFWGLFDGEHISGAQVLAMVGVLGMVALVQYGAVVRTAEPAETECKELACSGSTR